MIIKGLKVFIAFTLSYIILSINIAKKPIFMHLYELTGPLGTKSRDLLSKGFSQSKKYTKELFIEETPKKTKNIKKLKEKILKEKRTRDSFIQENISSDDTRKLNNLIERSR